MKVYEETYSTAESIVTAKTVSRYEMPLGQCTSALVVGLMAFGVAAYSSRLFWNLQYGPFPVSEEQLVNGLDWKTTLIQFQPDTALEISASTWKSGRKHSNGLSVASFKHDSGAGRLMLIPASAEKIEMTWPVKWQSLGPGKLRELMRHVGCPFYVSAEDRGERDAQRLECLNKKYAANTRSINRRLAKGGTSFIGVCWVVTSGPTQLSDETNQVLKGRMLDCNLGLPSNAEWLAMWAIAAAASLASWAVTLSCALLIVLACVGWTSGLRLEVLATRCSSRLEERAITRLNLEMLRGSLDLVQSSKESKRPSDCDLVAMAKSIEGAVACTTVPNVGVVKEKGWLVLKVLNRDFPFMIVPWRRIKNLKYQRNDSNHSSLFVELQRDPTAKRKGRDLCVDLGAVRLEKLEQVVDFFATVVNREAMNQLEAVLTAEQAEQERIEQEKQAEEERRQELWKRHHEQELARREEHQRLKREWQERRADLFLLRTDRSERSTKPSSTSGAAQPAADEVEQREVCQEDIEGRMCVICCQELSDRADCTKTVCNHVFHSSCLDEWLGSAHGKSLGQCPVCRTQIREPVRERITIDFHQLHQLHSLFMRAFVAAAMDH